MSFEIALSGINAVNSQLGNISNNIANSGTYGFKSSRDNFSAMYAGSQAAGVEVASVTQNIGRGGNVVATGRALDAAIQGGGFFMTRDAGGGVSYTRVGIFNIDKNGMLEDSFGRKVQGYAAETTQVINVPAKASSQLKYSGNLSADWTVPTVAFDIANPATFNASSESTVYDSLGKEHRVTQYFIKSASDIKVQYALDGNMVAGATSTLIFGADGKLTAPTAPIALPLGTPSGAAALSINIDYAGTTQLAGLATTSNNSADGNASGTATITNAVPAGTLGSLGDITLPTGLVAAKASTALKYSGNLSAGWSVPTVAFDQGNPATFNGSSLSTVYDSLGNKHNVTQYFVKSATDIKVHYAVDGVMVPATTSTLTFGTDGKLTGPAAPVALAMGTPAGAAALNITIDYAGTTQFAGETTTSVNSVDGYPAGTRTGLRIEDDGSLVATYSNGQRRTVATIALATFPNENGLTAISETSWEESSASGSPLLSAPGNGGSGKLVASSLEKSNVELTGELVNLMTAQRNYQANTKVISTQNQVVQALMQAI